MLHLSWEPRVCPSDLRPATAPVREAARPTTRPTRKRARPGLDESGADLDLRALALARR